MNKSHISGNNYYWGDKMPRTRRIEYNGAVYHVYQRGNNKEFIFIENEDKEYFLKLFIENMQEFNYKIFAYVIMNNHYHIIIQTFDISLQNIMHNINNKFSKYFNKKYERTGHVFEKRYSSKVVDKDDYLIWLLRYIHRNPVRANLCKEVDEYIWSSDIYYRKNISSFVDINFILNILSNNRDKSIKCYEELLKDPDRKKEEDFNNFRDKLNSLVNKPERLNRLKTLDEIFGELEISKEDKLLIKMGSRKRCLKELKKKFIKEAIKLNYTLDEIGSFIGISKGAVSKLLSE